MGKKDKTISFRVKQDTFESLREIADERDLSLSALFRDYVDALVAHDGQIEVVPEHATDATDTDTDDEPSFPPTATVPKSFVREHERLELEADHLREQLEEYRRYVTHLHDQLDENDGDDIVYLEELDGGEDDDDGFDHEEFEIDTDEPYRLG